jgi:lipid-A-disaccharide synthase
VAAEYVGHPLAELPVSEVTRDQFAEHYALDRGKPWIALLPGSRKKELQMNLPEMLRAAAMLGEKYEFLLPVASTLSPSWVLEQIGGSRVRLVEDARAALALAKASVVASGTATVEAALAGNPFIVVYRVSPLTYAIGMRLVRLEHYAMPNLIAGRRIVPELIQKRFTAEAVVEHLEPLLVDGPSRQQMVSDLEDVRRRLAPPEGSSAARRAASAVITVMSG